LWYIYVLESENNGRKYVGYTNDLKRRFEEHNRKSGGSYSKKQGKFKLVYYEAYLEKQDATKAERFYKSGCGREVLNGKLENYYKKNGA
jgi:putative endonuclease